MRPFSFIRCARTCILLIVGIILSILLPLRVLAQAGYFTESPVWYSDASNLTTSVALGDVDGDGDLDLVCGNEGDNTTLFENTGGTFSSMPVWYSGRADNTESVALGDIDGDGDLDLVCGNNQQSTTLYTNTGGTFSSRPIWSSNLSGSTRSVALGDVDGDGDLDLICGNWNGSTTLYENTGGTFSSFPVWYSDLSSSTRSVALGDVDRDGDLDLVCGNAGESTTLYENTGGTFSSLPIWSSGRTDNTESVALGDIDGDGDLDLFCGNGSNETISLYRNTGGTFSSLPVWSSTSGYFSRSSVALGDIDGDGDLDLVSGGAGPKLLFENKGGTFSYKPEWASVQYNRTRGVALGDIDGDGDLDLVCGNFRERAILHENIGATYSPLPAWSAGQWLYNGSVALSDVDGDADLDLICGRWSGPTVLYKNNGGTFSLMPVWSSSVMSYEPDLALGDVDGDGDPDLVCGNDRAPTDLYENTGGTFSLDPVWSSRVNEELDVYTNIALGDVDGDADPDLVCGYATATPATLYENTGGTFSLLPVWSAGRGGNNTVALGDVDRDGDLDLVCGTDLYKNTGGTFSRWPVWSSGSPLWCESNALGDVDGDGDLDLAVGNNDGPTFIYENTGGSFSSVPVWSSDQVDDTINLAFGDVDGDGDLDLVCAHWYAGLILYENTGEAFSLTPVWSSNRKWDVALGDVDADGDLDLVCGDNSGQGEATLLLNLKNPAYTGDPNVPVNQLPSNGAFLSHLAAAHSSENHYLVKFSACDVDSDRIWIVGEYQFEGEALWRPIELAGGATRTGPIIATPEGTTDSLEWDVTRVPFDYRDVVLRLRTVEIPRTVSIIQHAPSYLLPVGKIKPMRPQLTSSTDSLSFTTVSVGDTCEVQLVISNTGTMDLAIHHIDAPSPEMRVTGAATHSLAPGEADSITVLLEPRYETDLSGYLTISSNDPITPVDSIRIETDIRALEVATTLLKPGATVLLGEAVTLVITPAAQVNIERGYLFYRPAGALSFLDSIPISQLLNQFIAFIPGEAITEGGIEYFIRVENSGVFGTDPPGAPGVFYTQAVESPTRITAEPIPTSGQDYLSDHEIRVQVILPTGAIFMDGAVHYRKGGMPDYMIDSLSAGDVFPKATISDSMVTARGIEYWVDVNTLTTHLSDPPLDPALNPRTIPVTVQNLIEPHAHKGGDKADAYRIMSIPLEFRADFAGTIEALLTDQAAFGPYDPVKWRSWVYLPESGTYGELSDQSLAGRFRPEPGRAFWLISRANHQITTAPVSGLSTPTDGPFALELASGWNMVGSPFAFPVSWDSVRVDTLSMTEAVGVSVDPPIGWNGGYVPDAPTMEPFEGYWIYNRTENPATLHIPPKEALAGASPAPQAVTAQGSGFKLLLRVASCDRQDAYASIGTVPKAVRALDRFDRMKPPSAPEQGIAIYSIAQGEEERYYRLSTDMRSEPVSSGEWGEVWALDVMKSFSQEPAGDAVTIFIDSIAGIPADAKAILVDRTLDRKVTVEERGEYTFYLGMRDYAAAPENARFRLIVGTESFVEAEASRLLDLPTQAALYQNYPNPFNPSTIIRYDVAEPGRVSLRIYSVTGALVKVLEARHRDRGRYEAGWNGENERGEQVASGIYFYRLMAPGYSQTRKMVLVR